MQGVHSNHPS